jgi:hypothetical protein
MVHAGVYASVIHYLKAVEAGKSAADGKAVVERMKAMPTDDPLFGKGTVRADGRKIHDMYLYEVKKPSESKGAWDYYKLRATIPAAEAFRPFRHDARARTVLLAPTLLPSVAGRCTQDLDPCFGKGAADPRDVLGHRPLPNLFVNGPRPGLAWCVAHNLWVRRPSKVRIFQPPWGRARRRWDAVLELEPALTKAMLVDVEGEATLLRTEGPDSARLLRRPTMQLRARAPPALAAPTLHTARSLVRPACRAALACVTHFEAQAPHCCSVTRVTSVLMGVAQLVESNAGARATSTVHERAE